MVGGNSHRSWYIQPTYVRQRACAHHPATSGQPAEGLRAQGCAHTSSSAPTQGHRSLTSPASWRSGRGEHQPAPAPPAQPQPAVTAGSQGQPASVRAGCCSARGHEGWLLLSQGSEGGLGQSPRQMVGWDPAGRAGGRLLRSMRNETSSGGAATSAMRARQQTRRDCQSPPDELTVASRDTNSVTFTPRSLVHRPLVPASFPARRLRCP